MRLFISATAILFISGSFCFGEDCEILTVAPRVVAELRVITTARGMPVYEYEVNEAVRQHAHELQGLSGEEYAAQERAIFKRELRRIIERELIIDEMLSFLRARDRRADIDELFEISAKDAATRMNDVRRKVKISDDKQFKTYLESQGITVEGLRRHFARGTMANIYISELLKPIFKSITLEELKAYYDRHPSEFYSLKHVEWSQRVVRLDQFESREQARHYAKDIVCRFAKGPGLNLEKKADDILWKLECDFKVESIIGPSSSAITAIPVIIAPLVWSLQEGEVGTVETTDGIHVVRVTKRTNAERKPFTDDSVREEIRKQLQAEIGERVYREVAKKLVVRALAEQALAGKQKSNIEATSYVDTNPIENAPLSGIRAEENHEVLPVAPHLNREPLVLPQLPGEDHGTARDKTEVKVVTTVRGMPIYESEVREAVCQRAEQLLSFPSYERKAHEQAMFKQELRRIIERELIIDELLSNLRAQNRQAAIDELYAVCAKDTDERLNSIREKLKISNDEEFKRFLTVQGLTTDGLRRYFERGTMVNIFMKEIIKPRVESITPADLKGYYDNHPDEFRINDRVKWQDLFILKDRFNSSDDARKYCEQLAERARKGEDFVAMVEKLDHRKLRNADGLGEEKGQIFPSDVEPMVFELKQGEVGIVEVETGFHIVRIAERTYAARRPFTDSKVQQEIRKRFEHWIGDREYRELVKSLRMQDLVEEILAEDKKKQTHALR